MRSRSFSRPIGGLPTGLLLLLLPACSHVPERPTWRYLQRSPVRVAILPSNNQTAKEGASLVVDEAWENVLRKAGFVVVNADAVVTYVSSRGVPLSKLSTVPTAKLGADLRVDYLLSDNITDWGTKYRVLASGSSVSCQTTLVEASTGAVIWANDWTMAENSNSGGNNGLAGVLANALVNAVVDSMTDRPTQLARQGIAGQSTLQPYPGFAPPLGNR
jgi:hypothetical protein